LAKYAEQYIHKGDKLYVEGRIRNRSYDDKKGVRRQVTEIYVDNLEWLSASRKMENASEEKNKDADNSISDNNKLPF
jgi:single-strand binding protein